MRRTPIILIVSLLAGCSRSGEPAAAPAAPAPAAVRCPEPEQPRLPPGWLELGPREPLPALLDWRRERDWSPVVHRVDLSLAEVLPGAPADENVKLVRFHTRRGKLIRREVWALRADAALGASALWLAGCEGYNSLLAALDPPPPATPEAAAARARGYLPLAAGAGGDELLPEPRPVATFDGRVWRVELATRREKTGARYRETVELDDAGLIRAHRAEPSIMLH